MIFNPLSQFSRLGTRVCYSFCVRLFVLYGCGVLGPGFPLFSPFTTTLAIHVCVCSVLYTYFHVYTCTCTCIFNFAQFCSSSQCWVPRCSLYMTACTQCTCTQCTHTCTYRICSAAWALQLLCWKYSYLCTSGHTCTRHTYTDLLLATSNIHVCCTYMYTCT